MLYLTCTIISNVDLARYGVSRAKEILGIRGIMTLFYSTPLRHNFTDNRALKETTAPTMRHEVMAASEPISHISIKFYA